MDKTISIITQIKCFTMLTPFISIIIPVYNAEMFLACCLDSIIAQTFKNFEVILVNDGSTDSSNLILENYARKDKRFKVILKDNTGVSDSRNIGLNNAVGEYVIFVDADDFWCDNSCLEKLYLEAKEKSIDVVRGEFKIVDEKGFDVVNINNKVKSKLPYAHKRIDSFCFLNDIINGEFFIWLCLIRRISIRGLYFEKDRIYLEDMVFYAKMLCSSLSYSYIPLCFYAYRNNSMNSSSKISFKKLSDAFSISYIFNQLKNDTTNLSLKRSFSYYSVTLYFYNLDLLSFDPLFQHRKNLVKKLELNRLHRNVLCWSIADRIFNKTTLFLSFKPIMAIWILRIIHRVILFAKRWKNILL